MSINNSKLQYCARVAAVCLKTAVFSIWLAAGALFSQTGQLGVVLQLEILLQRASCEFNQPYYIAEHNPDSNP